MEKEKRKFEKLLAESAPRLKIELVKKNKEVSEVSVKCGLYFVKAKVSKKGFLKVFVLLLQQLPHILLDLLTPCADMRFHVYSKLWHSNNPDITENCFDKLCLQVAHMRDITKDIRARSDADVKSGKIIRLYCTKADLLQFLQLANNLCVEYNRFILLFVAASQTIEKLEEEEDVTCIGLDGLISKYGDILVKTLNEQPRTLYYKVADDNDLIQFGAIEMD